MFGPRSNNINSPEGQRRLHYESQQRRQRENEINSARAHRENLARIDRNAKRWREQVDNMQRRSSIGTSTRQSSPGDSDRSVGSEDKGKKALLGVVLFFAGCWLVNSPMQVNNAYAILAGGIIGVLFTPIIFRLRMWIFCTLVCWAAYYAWRHQ